MSTNTLQPLGEALLLEELPSFDKYRYWRVLKKNFTPVCHIEWFAEVEQYVIDYVNPHICLQVQHLRDLAGFLDQVNGARDGS